MTTHRRRRPSVVLLCLVLGCAACTPAAERSGPSSVSGSYVSGSAGGHF